MGAELIQVEEFSVTHPSGHICADCGEDIKYNEEAWLLQVMQLQLVGTPPPRQFAYHQVIDEDDVHGSFIYEPYFFCFDCWETAYNNHSENMADEPPVVDAFSALECVCCGSGVREFEHAGVFTLGEFHPSKRAPNNVRGPHFEPISAPNVLCLYCLSLLNNDYIDMWEALSQTGECDDCLQMRCWRGECSCSCHTDGNTDDDEITGD